jgi:NhaP-type Na+/H+ or K+/H+ antiporter
MAYTSYIVAELATLSGIMSLFFCGIVISHYALYNISAEGQATTRNLFKAFALIAETFLFAYLGVTAVISFQSNTQSFLWSPRLMFATLLWVLLSRAANVFPLALLANCCRKGPSKITFKMAVVMWLAGLRGAIAFALVLQVESASRAYVRLRCLRTPYGTRARVPRVLTCSVHLSVCSLPLSVRCAVLCVCVLCCAVLCSW